MTIWRNIIHSKDVDIPVACEIIHKPVLFSDPEIGRIRRKSEITKNEMLRDMLRICTGNHLNFRYVLTDNWFSSKETM